MTDAAHHDDDRGGVTREEDTPSLVSAPAAAAAVDEQVGSAAAVVAGAQAAASVSSVARDSTEESDAAAEQEEEDDHRPHDDFLDVVVTSADAFDANSSSNGASSSAGVVASAISASSSLLLGSQEEYIVELVVTRGSGSYCIRRSLSELLAVLQLPDPAGNVVLPVSEIPGFPTKQSQNDALIAKWCGDMTQFLTGQSSELRCAPKWIEFIEESSQGKGSRAHMTAIEFILQPFQYEKFYVPRGSRHELIVPAKKEAHFIVWKFDLEEHDIDFFVSFSIDPQWALRQPSDAGLENDESLVRTVHARTRYLATTTGRPIEGTLSIETKNILYQVQVVSGEIMESATAAADALDEALKAKKKERDDAIAASLSTALIVSPLTPPAASSVSLYKNFLPETLMQQSWIVTTPMNVAGKLASRLFGSQSDPEAAVNGGANGNGNGGDDDDDSSSHHDSAQAKSLLEELNGLNMQLLERLENLEDKVVKLTVERDQERSKTHMAVVDKENTMTQVHLKELEVESLRNELQRMQREREAWGEIQSERDALLEEKHRWAMVITANSKLMRSFLPRDQSDDFDDEESEDDVVTRNNDMDSESRNRLEHELGQAEASVLRLRAELGYSLTNHLTGTSTRLEKIAREMTDAKKQYEDQMKASEHEIMALKQQLIKFRCQKKVLVTEIRNMKTQTEGQISVAMAEASEARMVNKRLKKQNELLLTQIRTLVDDSRQAERSFREQQEQLQRQQELQSQFEENGKLQDEDYDEGKGESATATVAVPVTMVALHLESQSADGSGSESRREDEARDEENGDESTVPYTLSAADIALLNGQMVPPPAPAPSHPVSSAQSGTEQDQWHGSGTQMNGSQRLAFNPYRARLVAFFKQKDPSMLPDVEEMLKSYKGVESSLFESLELKYSFMEINQKIAQQ